MAQELLKYWNAFVLLSRSRTSHFAGSNPIALSEIKAFFEIFEINDIEEREDFVYFIKELDAELLTLERAEQKTT